MFTQDQVANWFLSRMPMSPKKLQKILYYAYAWVLTLTNDNVKNLENRLFENNFEAWAHGPVLPHVYYEYRNYGFNKIDNINNNNIPDFPEDILDILNQVMDIYGKYTADQLESITHQETPWIIARGNCSPLEICKNQITDEEIYSYYIQRVS